MEPFIFLETLKNKNHVISEEPRSKTFSVVQFKNAKIAFLKCKIHLFTGKCHFSVPKTPERKIGFYAPEFMSV